MHELHTQEQVNDFCRAVSAVYYDVVHRHAIRTNTQPRLPELLCPLGEAPSLRDYDPDTIEEAERFLLRMGLIAEGTARCDHENNRDRQSDDDHTPDDLMG